MRERIIDWLRRLMGTKRIAERLDCIERALLERLAQPDSQPLDGALDILPGTEYSRYAIPLDYPPSRDFSPRYGYSRGKIGALEEWFKAYHEDHAEFIGYMRSLKVGHIPLDLSANSPLAPAWIGGPICAFDSLALYAMVTKHRPKLYLEIGSGMTTCFARQAVRDAGLDTKIVSIDPQPRREVDAICDEVIRHGLETCDLAIFDQLEAGDILFFDGSHRSFMNSDVTVFFIDVLPRIKAGVVIHIHDILLPWDYPDSFKYWYWNEQYLLAVYLMCSLERLRPMLPTAWVCRSVEFDSIVGTPFIDLGSSDANLSWRGGGSLWFSKTRMT
jgi:hypothetical protein